MSTSSVLPSSVRELVKHKFVEDRYIPYIGEIIIIDSLKTLLAPALIYLLSPICRLVPLAAITTTQFYYHPAPPP